MNSHPESYSERRRVFGNVRRLLVFLSVLILLAVFLIWRIEGDRMERVRVAILDALMPAVELGGRPLDYLSNFAVLLNSHLRLIERNEDLELQVSQLEYWKERARTLERQNALLKELLNAPTTSAPIAVSAQVIADTSSQFRYSVLVDVGTENGVIDGWPVVDGSGLVGRVSGVGRQTARVLLLADSSSRVPVKIVGSNTRGIAVGDGTSLPQLQFAAATDIVPGQKIMTSGDGGVYPPDILLGDIVIGSDNVLRVRLLADIWRLDYVSLLRVQAPEAPPVGGDVISVVPPNTTER